MSFETALRCRECGREYTLTPIYSCEFCFGPLEVAYDYDAIRAAMSRDRVAAGALDCPLRDIDRMQAPDSTGMKF